MDRVNTEFVSYSVTSHTHDSRYYTESEVDGLLGAKANTVHTHDDRYYTETEIDNKLTGFTATTGADVNVLAYGGVVALGYNSTTGERGFLTKYINRTGGASVKGTLVSCSTATDKEIIKQASEYDTIGVMAESGIAEGAECWVWKSGSRCQVLYKDSTAATRGNILIADAVDGRASDITNPGSGLPAAETHFKECGHVCETKSGGTNVLVLAEIHFN